MSDKKTDTLVLELLKKVEEKKQQIGSAERPSWLTNCSFGFDQTSNARINIQVVREIESLVEIHAFICDKHETYNISLGALGIPEKDAPFKWMGFSYQQWESDIRTRLNGLRLKQKRDELMKLEERVNALVSPEQRRALELEKLVKELE
jgi:hypothetical protein